jgi:putative phage-type endonuclease
MQAQRIDLEQGSVAWLEWRQGGVGASDVPVLMGLSDYSTPYKLWLQKRGKEKGQDVNVAMATGHDREAQLRAGYELQEGQDFPAACYESLEYPWMRISLDGCNESLKAGIEMKYVGAEYYEQGGIDTALHTIKPDHMAQMQYQMLVMGYDFLLYAKTVDGQHFKTQKVQRDMVIQEQAFLAASVFWHHVQADLAPPYTDGDWIPNTDPELVNEVKTLELMLKEDRPKKSLEPVRARIFEMCGDVKRTEVDNCKISKLKVKSIRFS